MSSGVPSATACIWDWKRQIFLSRNPGLEDHYKEITLGSVRKRLQAWLDGERCWPRQGADEEYSTYIEACYPLSRDRASYFQELCREARPFAGYRFLKLLAESGLFKIVWTTNFDGLVAKAVADSTLTLIECGLDTPNRVERAPHTNELLHIALHGDYRYDELKNTTPELQSQDATLRRDLVQRLQNTHLVVCGYSGRDESVMSALHEAYRQSGPGRLLWCGMTDSQPSEAVCELLALARQNGREAFYVESDGFDDVMRRLALSCLEDEAAEAARRINETQPQQLEVPPFRLERGEAREVLRSNAFFLDCPSSIWQFSAKNLPDQGRWKYIEELTEGAEGHQVLAAPFKDEILALGALASVRHVFARHIADDIKQGIVTTTDLMMQDGVIVRLFASAITRSLAQTHNLATNGRSLLWEKDHYTTRRVLDFQCRVYHAVSLAVRRYGGSQYVVLQPTITSTNLQGERLPEDVEKELKRQILSIQRNQAYVQALNTWRNRLFSSSEPFYFPPNELGGAEFKVSDRNALAVVHDLPQSSGTRSAPIVLDRRQQRLVRHTGVRVAEPQLIFTARGSQTRVQDANPLRGIARNRPYDYALTQRHLNDIIRVAVVAPQEQEVDVRGLVGFLHSLHETSHPGANQEYVLPYLGFEAAFGVTLQVPQPNAAEWIFYPVPPDTRDPLADATRLRQNITTAVERLHDRCDFDVVMIHVPHCCEDIIRLDYEGGRFDLRRLIKAFCIERGIASQLLLDKTLYGDDRIHCQSMWWLALALYVKANRTPWVLSGHDEDTAFAGLGFSLEQGGATGKHVTIGCSHIYNSRGIDLKYKLSGLDDVWWKHDNPFLSRDDARRIGEGVRELFFEATGRLPRRVVLHKRTPFIENEKKGLLEGLDGVEIVDLLEVTIEPHLRFMTNTFDREGQLRSARFPVSRDTVLQLDSHRALLWIHGTMPSVQENRNYYMGGYGIPTPLVVRRAFGETPLTTLAHELLGLSKMNWNTFSPYTKAPATIQSSNDIARIGNLLTRFGSTSYDYRLFI